MLDFPVGYRRFHPADALNYVLNRWLATADECEMAAAASRVRSIADWKREFLALGAAAASEGRSLHASTYFRAAEFFMSFADEDKLPTYELYREHFSTATADIEREEHLVDFAGGKLPAIRIAASGPRKDTVVLHGGFDSYMEEFLVTGLVFSRLGYDFIMFEGPGQGAALRRHGLTMAPEWERPVSAVLDHFGVEACTLIGISLGGYLAPRAAAFEPRIRRVIAWNMLSDFLGVYAHRVGQFYVDGLFRLLSQGKDEEVDAAMARSVAANESTEWAMRHGMHISGSKTPSAYLRWLRRMSTASFSDRITQDVLILAGAEDHIVPLSQLCDQLKTLSHASSVTVRLFTAADEAHNHCQVGNKEVALLAMESWLTEVLRPKAPWSGGADLQRDGLAACLGQL